MYETSVRIGSCTISFQRTLRVPGNGDEPGPPPAFGVFPVAPLARKPLTVAIPLYRQEAMSITFESPLRPNAVLVNAGGINAISGQPWVQELRRRPQNYLVCPDQSRLDGFRTSTGALRQFTAAREAEADGTAELQLIVFEGKTDLKRISRRPGTTASFGPADPYGKKMWDLDRSDMLKVELLPVAVYEKRTGLPVPETPVDRESYVNAGLPWLALYDEDFAGAAASSDRPMTEHKE